MVKGHERKSYQPSSSAKAAQLLSGSGTAGGFGFGGFSGATPIATSAQALPASSTDAEGTSSAATAPVLSGDQDSEITQLLKSLSKRDATTKSKALQKLKTVVAGKDAQTVAACLPPWAYVYNKLVMDNNRTVRTEASGVLGAMTKLVGKGLAPYLKALAGSWWLAQFDSHAEAAAAAREAFQNAFSGPKQKEALLFTRTEVLLFLQDNLKATPEALGDAKKETPEELAERHERVTAASLLALSSLLDLLVSQQQHDNPTERSAQSEVVVQLESLLGGHGFLKRMLGSKNAPVRTAAYTLMAHTCYRAPQLLEKHVQTAAPLILGAFQEQQSSAHSSMWEMVLAFVKAYPSAWHAVDMRKAVLPRLLAFLRSGCYGSGSSSFPAVLPFLHLLPKGLLGPEPRVGIDTLEALWAGCAAQPPGQGREAAAAAFVECLCWLLSQAGSLAGGQGKAEGYATAALQGPLCSQVVPATLQGNFGISNTAMAIVADTLNKIKGLSGDRSWLLPSALSQLGAAVAGLLSTQLSNSAASSSSAAAQPFNRTGSLLESLQGACPQPLLEQHVAGPLAAALLGHVQEGSAPPEAAALLAKLVKQFGARVMTAARATPLPGAGRTTGALEGQALSLQTVLDSALAGPQGGPSAQANADLLLSCIQGQDAPATQLANTLSQVLGVTSAPGDSSPVIDSDAIVTGRYSEEPSGVSARGAAFAVLLVQRLLHTDAQKAGHVLKWQSPELDALACKLICTETAADAVNSEQRGGDPVSETTQAGGDSAPAQEDAAQAGDLAVSVAAASLDASEQTEAAQQTPLDYINSGVAELGLEDDTALDEADASCCQLLGLLISGKGNASLLSDQAVHQTLSSLASQLECKVTAGKAQLQALLILDACLYSEAVSAMSNVSKLRDQMVALVFKLSWRAKRAVKLADSYIQLSNDLFHGNRNDSDDDAESDLVTPEANDTPPQGSCSQVAAKAMAVWAQGKRAAELFASATTQERSHLDAALQDVLQPHLDRLCFQENQEPDWQLQAAALVQEAVRAVASEAASTQSSSASLLDLILEPLKSLEDTNPQTAQLAASLCQVLGFEAVLLTDPPRAYVAAKLLSIAWMQPMYDTALKLHNFLKASADSNTSAAEASTPNTLLADTIDVLSDVARRQPSPDSSSANFSQPTSQAAACVSALIDLLGIVTLHGSQAGLSVIARWFKRSIASDPPVLPESVVAEVLQAAVKALRSSEELLLSSGLPEFTQQRLRSSNKPPIAALVDQPRSDISITEYAQSLKMTCSCFPCPSSALSSSSSGQPTTTAGAGPEAIAASVTTAAERQALLAAAVWQMQGERSVAIAAAAAKRAVEGQEAQPSGSSAAASASSSGRDNEASACVARLVLCAVTHCWQDISSHTWSDILKRLGTSVSQAAVLMEDLTEGVAAAAVGGASKVSRSRQGGDVGPQVAVELLWRLQHLGLADNNQAVKDAGQQMQGLLSDDSTVRRLRGEPQACMQTLAFIIALNTSNQPPALQQAAPQETIAAGTKDALRALFALGSVQAITQATGVLSATVGCAILCLHADSLWDAVTAVARTAASEKGLQAIISSVQEADAWGQDTGVDATGALLASLLNFATVQGLQSTALALLLTPPLLSGVTAASVLADEESIEAPPAKQDSVTALIRAGVRPQLAAAICAPPEAPSDPQGDQGLNETQTFLLAWALLLAHILGMPAGDSGKAFLAQALRDEYEVVPGLLNTVLPLLPLDQFAAQQSKKGSKPQSRPKQQAKQWSLVASLQQLRVMGTNPLHRGSEFMAQTLERLAEAAYRGVLHALPASARAWFGDFRDRGLSAAVEAYTAEQASPVLLQHEFHLVQAAPSAPDMDKFSLKANSITREVVAVMEVEEGAVLEMVIKLPISSPLRRAEVACRQRVGVTEGKLRKWLLSVTAFLANQNGSVAEAIALWQRNVQKEFEGVEECLICYSIVSASDGKLPKMHCRTCSKRFHGSCLYKWFQSSGKSNCPHCQSPW